MTASLPSRSKRARRRVRAVSCSSMRPPCRSSAAWRSAHCPTCSPSMATANACWWRTRANRSITCRVPSTRRGPSASSTCEQGVANATVRTADFQGFSRAELNARGIRVFAPDTTAAQDLEPEYITVKGRTAWVTLQEANAVAIVDVPTATVQDIVPLGLKDHSLPGNALDPSDRDGPIAHQYRELARLRALSAGRDRQLQRRRPAVPGHGERRRFALERRLPGLQRGGLR